MYTISKLFRLTRYPAIKYKGQQSLSTICWLSASNLLYNPSCPFSQLCEIDINIPSLQKRPKTVPSLFQRG